MKIIYLHQYFNTPSMPGGTRSFEIAKRLVSKGHIVHMVTSDCTPGIKKKGWYHTLESGIHVHWLANPYDNSFSFNKRIRSFFQFAIRSAIKAEQLGGDVVFATSTPLTIAIPGIYASKLNHIPMVFEVRDLWPELPIAVGALKHPLLIACAKLLEDIAYGCAKHVIALSPGMKQGVVKNGYAPNQISVIPNGCDFDLFDMPDNEIIAFREKYHWLKDRPLVLYAGALGIINGVSYLAYVADAVKKLDSSIRFLVVGTGKEENKVRELANKLGILNQNFFMHPHTLKCDIPKYFKAADISTSLFIPLKPMEANSANKFFDSLASGTPVAINYKGWQADLLINNGAGIVLDSYNYQTAAKDIVQTLYNKTWLKTAGMAAKTLAIEHFSRDTLVDAFEKVLLNVVTGYRL